MLHYGLCMTTSICHLILFIILAMALSDLSLPIAGFNAVMCYIMIMSGLGTGMLSASHWGRMKWINIPEGAESGGSACLRHCVCVCVYAHGQTALGDQCAELLAASNSVSLSAVLCCIYMHKHRLLWPTFRRSKKSSHTVYQPSDCFVTNFTRLYLFSGAAGRASSRQPGVELWLVLI